MSSATDIDIAPDLAREARRTRLFGMINKADSYLKLLGLSWVTPILKAAAGDNPKAQVKEIWQLLGVPLLAIAAFLMLWGNLAPTVQTSLGAIPGPAQVWEQVENLHSDHLRERDKAAAFYDRQVDRNAKLVAEGKEDRVKWRDYTGKPTYYDQIWTSIQTVFFGFLLATVIAVPIGIICGLSPTANAAFNPLIQIFKPVSPLAWLPIVTMVVSAVYVTNDGAFSKSFLNSAITVT
ncbi:MAG: ABC transporter permease, partial [Pseudomonadota bacterium]